MNRSLWVVVLLLVAAGCGDDEPAARSPEPIPGADTSSSAIGDWKFVSLEVDGRPIEILRPLSLGITDSGFRASTTCNSVSGELGVGVVEMTAMGCDGSAGTNEGHMIAAFDVDPGVDGDRLVFDTGNVRLVYERITEPEPEPAELYAVLADDDALVDPSVLPSEQVTGSVPPDVDRLVRLPSPDPAVELFLALFQGKACVVDVAGPTIDQTCPGAEYASAFDVPRYEQPIVRIALIPDRFAAAVSTRNDLGTLDGNVLAVSSDAPVGEHVLFDDEGERFVLVIPPPWIDPMAAASTTAPG